MPKTQKEQKKTKTPTSQDVVLSNQYNDQMYGDLENLGSNNYGNEYDDICLEDEYSEDDEYLESEYLENTPQYSYRNVDTIDALPRPPLPLSNTASKSITEADGRSLHVTTAIRNKPTKTIYLHPHYIKQYAIDQICCTKTMGANIWRSQQHADMLSGLDLAGATLGLCTGGIMSVITVISKMIASKSLSIKIQKEMNSFYCNCPDIQYIESMTELLCEQIIEQLGNPLKHNLPHHKTVTIITDENIIPSAKQMKYQTQIGGIIAKQFIKQFIKEQRSSQNNPAELYNPYCEILQNASKKAIKLVCGHNKDAPPTPVALDPFCKKLTQHHQQKPSMFVEMQAKLDELNAKAKEIEKIEKSIVCAMALLASKQSDPTTQIQEAISEGLKMTSVTHI